VGVRGAEDTGERSRYVHVAALPLAQTWRCPLKMGCGSSKGPPPQEHQKQTTPDKNRADITGGTSSEESQAFPGRQDRRSPSNASGFASDGSDDGDDEGSETIDKIRAYLVRAAVADCYGFGLGMTAGNEIFVTDLVDGGTAAKSLCIADRVDKINGAAASTMTFQRILSQVSTSLVLMLECSRLRELSTTPGPGEDASQKSRSISTVMPDVQLVSRRPSVGRLSISRPPSLEPITEARPAAVEAGETPEVLATQLVVVLKRPAATSTYGFGLAASADDKLYIYKISSNIHNWGMLQVGDRVASINGTPTENVDCDKAVELINTSNEAHLGLVRQKRLAPKADIISSRGSLALAIPPRLLMSRLSKLQVERAAEESKQAKAGFVDDDDAPQSTDLSFAQSIASIISTAGL